MSDPFKHFDRIRESFRQTKSTSQLNSTGKYLSKADYVKSNLPSSSSDSKMLRARSSLTSRGTTKRPSNEGIEGTVAEPRKVKWFTSPFDDDIEIIGEKPPPRKRGKLAIGSVSTSRRATTTKKKKAEEEVVNDENMAPFIGGINANMFEPKRIEDLAVNSKKIEEVKDWIQSKMTPVKSRKILLLTGPCGCGKTSTLKLLCADLGVDFLEFDLPQEGDYNEYDNYTETKPIEIFEKYVKSCEFLSTEANAPKHRLLCIENLPNIFYRFREPGKLKESLLRCAAATRCIIVFIMSTTEKGWDFSPARLFPPSVMNELQATEIKFNSIATTNMSKAVHKMIDAMNINATSSMVKSIVEQADGDIRCAINNIQFSTLKKSFKGGISSAINHITTFHFIGKIMYAKRMEASTSQDWRNVENKMKTSKWRRLTPPKDDLNYLTDNSVLSGSRLADYIFEHEPNFAPSITACSRVLRDICEFDSIHSRCDYYEHASMINKYYTDIAIRTTIYNNYQCAAGQAKVSRTRQLYQFKKPQLTEVTRTRLETKLNLVKLLPRLRSADLFMTTVPLLPRTTFFTRPEEKKIINALSLREKVSATSWGGVRIKVNPRPISSKNLGAKNDSPRTKPYMANTIEEEKEEEFDIEESDDDDSF